MLYCGRLNNVWVGRALEYLPEDVFEEIDGKIAITILSSDACRLAQKITKIDEVIVLSPWLFSYIPPRSSETDKEWRYFIFAILHEIAHAVLNHSPPDELKYQDNTSQEDEADEHAVSWFNSYVSENVDKGLAPLTIEEVRETQAKYNKKLEPILNHGKKKAYKGRRGRVYKGRRGRVYRLQKMKSVDATPKVRIRRRNESRSSREVSYK